MISTRTGETFRAAQFARLAGVTVRTLHHYDQLGLLHASARTEAGYRVYTRADLLRMQQILTLKWMGFGLETIKELLDAPEYDFRAALGAQKDAIDAQIARLRHASDAIDQALAAGDESALDVAAVLRAIHPVQADLSAYYSEAAAEGIRTRALSYTPEQLTIEFPRQWAELYAAFAAIRDQPPTSPAAQRLAARMDDLVRAFTGDDPEAEAGLRRIHADPNALPPAYRSFDADPDLQAFMRAAHEHYRDKR